MNEPASPVEGQLSRTPSRACLWGFCALPVAVLLLDQFTKYLVGVYLPLGKSIPALGPVLSLTLSHNSGAALGLWPAAGRSLAAIAALFVVAILVWGRRYAAQNRCAGWGLYLLMGGALGNLVDRLRFGYVVDFLDLHFWPVFNVADIAVVTGAALILLGVALGTQHGSCGCRGS